MKVYYISYKSLNSDERDELYNKLNGFSFMTNIDLKNHYFVVYWNSSEDITKVIDFPEGCSISQ